MTTLQERFDKNWDDYAQHVGYSNEASMLTDLYITKSLSLNQIARRLGCSPHTVRHHLEKHKIDRRPKGGDNNTANQTRKLFRLDQRVILFGDLHEVARAAHVSTTLLWKYRRLMKEDLTWSSVYCHHSNTSNTPNSQSATSA